MSSICLEVTLFVPQDIDADANLLRPVGSRVRTVHVDLYTEAAKKVRAGGRCLIVRVGLCFPISDTPFSFASDVYKFLRD